MTRIFSINTEKAPTAIGPYSQAVVVGDLVYTSGQIPIDPKTGEVVNTGITGQTEQVMQNLKNVLQEANSSFANTIKTTCFLSNMDNFTAFNEVYAKYFVSKPARSCVAVKALPKDVLCEVEVIALREEYSKK